MTRRPLNVGPILRVLLDAGVDLRIHLRVVSVTPSQDSFTRPLARQWPEVKHRARSVSVWRAQRHQAGYRFPVSDDLNFVARAQLVQELGQVLGQFVGLRGLRHAKTLPAHGGRVESPVVPERERFWDGRRGRGSSLRQSLRQPGQWSGEHRSNTACRRARGQGTHRAEWSHKCAWRRSGARPARFGGARC